MKITKLIRQMKKQGENIFLSDWQIRNYPSSELADNQKDYEIEEEEYKFYNSGKEVYTFPRKHKLRVKSS